MRAAASNNNNFVFGNTALGQATVVGGAAISLATDPVGCHMDADISTPTVAALTNGQMHFNTNAGTAKLDKVKVCKSNQCTCDNGIGATGAACLTNGAAKCASCNAGYFLKGNECTRAPPPPPPSPSYPPFPPGEAPCDFWCSYSTCGEYKCSGCHSMCHPDLLAAQKAAYPDCSFWCNSWTCSASLFPVVDGFFKTHCSTCPVCA